MTRILIVTGMAGAGRTSALRILEDLGYEAVDNLPLPLLPRILAGESGEGGARLALGIDTRSRRFDAATLLEELARAPAGDSLRLLFLDADDETLLRRFTETRRRHPLALDRPVADGIQRERRLIEPLRAAADWVIDTSRLSLPLLRRMLQARFGAGIEGRLLITVMSFAFPKGLPREADLLLDVRFLRNPHYEEKLRPLTGLHPAVQEHVRGDPCYAEFEERVMGLLRLLLPRYLSEGKSYLTLAVGCTGGRHRSVFVVERLADRLKREDWQVVAMHRELPALDDPSRSNG